MVSLISEISQQGAEEGLDLKSVTLCDTEGQATPKEIFETVASVKKAFPHLVLRMHLHPKRETALESIHAAMDGGASEWEGSWGGMGGSPYAENAGGNLDIRYLVKAWSERGLEHGLNIPAIYEFIEVLRTKISRTIPEITI